MTVLRRSPNVLELHGVDGHASCLSSVAAPIQCLWAQSHNKAACRRHPLKLLTGVRASRRKILAEARRQFKSRPEHEYPTIVALADHLTEDAQDDLFQFGIDMCLRGVQALLKRDS